MRASFLLLGTILAGLSVASASGETLQEALLKAYQTNPTLTGQRAGQRAADQNVPLARAAGRPTVATSGGLNENFIRGGNSFTSPERSLNGTIGVTVPVYQGGAVRNSVRAAEIRVEAGQSTLRQTEAQLFTAVVGAYNNVLRDEAIVGLNAQNVRVLETNLRASRDRFEVGDLTRTDVAQAESRLAAARATMLQAESNYTTSRSTYRQVIGVEPGKLDPASPVDRLSPSNLQQAVLLARSQHPAVTSQMFTVDAAVFAVKVAESSLYPSLSAVGSVQKTTSASTTVVEGFTASALAQLTIPVYQGGSEYSLIRQAKEQLQQQRVNLDNQRDVQQQNLVQTWGALEAAKAQVLANQQAVTAAEIALNGVREEARVGQRTTLDVLNAQQELVNARVNLVSAQRDRVVNSYTLLAAVGGLSPTVLQLDVPIYDPVVHYHQVRDTWAGVRTPDGK